MHIREIESGHILHLYAGASAGTVGAILTCPLEVVKTRMQSSDFKQMSITPARYSMKPPTKIVPPKSSAFRSLCTSALMRSQVVHLSKQLPSIVPRKLSLRYCIMHILKVEGPLALWKGLLPNILGVAPSRAIYFYSYNSLKAHLMRNTFVKNEKAAHIISSFSGGFLSCTATNPIWFVKTRLQLDRSMTKNHNIGTLECIGNIYKTKGLRGFYKGMTASYYGISETMIYFAVYEAVKSKLVERRGGQPDMTKTSDYLEIMFTGAGTKVFASTLSYPHEVARTRLREDGKKYKRFWQTLKLVLKEEGYPGLYRGLPTQLLRQIPNAGIMMLTYESMVSMLNRRNRQALEIGAARIVEMERLRERERLLKIERLLEKEPLLEMKKDEEL